MLFPADGRLSTLSCQSYSREADVRHCAGLCATHSGKSDNGVGIAPEDRALVFKEFRQVGADYTRKVEETGLGLALTKKFVELHGGRIWVESEKGKGSTFTLPVQHEEAARGGSVSAAPSS